MEREPVSIETDAIAKQIVDAVFTVHKKLGPGLLEGVYEACLVHELKKRGIKVQQQVALPVIYDDLHLEAGFRLDLLIEEKVIIELKSVERLLPIHKAQVLTYLKLSGHRLAFLINFNVPLIKDGIERIVS
jgi:GxxExxY protein